VSGPAELEGLIAALLRGLPPEDGVVMGNTAAGRLWVAGLPGVAQGALLTADGQPAAVVCGLGAQLVEAASLGPALAPRTRLQASGGGPAIPTGEALLGRILDPVGRPLDGGPPPAGPLRPWLRRAPVAAEVGPRVDLPSGTLAIDHLAPLRRGRSAVILGGRGRGKSTLALAAVRAQARHGGADVVVYVHIGNSAASLHNRQAHLVQERGAVAQIAALVTAPPALQEGAILGALTVAESLAEGDRHVLVVIDELPGGEAPSLRLLSAIRAAFARVVAAPRRSISLLAVGAAPGGDLSAPLPTELALLADRVLRIDEDAWEAGARPALALPRVGGLAPYLATYGPRRLHSAALTAEGLFAQGAFDCLGPAAWLLRLLAAGRLSGLDPADAEPLRRHLDAAVGPLAADIAVLRAARGADRGAALRRLQARLDAHLRSAGA